VTVTTTRSLLFGAAAADVRRRVGPTAWVVLEATVARAEADGGVITSVVSARSLAAELGLAKNTTARALSVLRLAGLLVAVQPRDCRGTFAAGSYRVHLPANSLEHASAVASPVFSSRTRRITPIAVAQLSLLPR